MPEPLNFFEWVDEEEAREAAEEGEPAQPIQYRKPVMYEGDDIPF
jgi:hypothetical protein